MQIGSILKGVRELKAGWMLILSVAFATCFMAFDLKYFDAGKNTAEYRAIVGCIAILLFALFLARIWDFTSELLGRRRVRNRNRSNAEIALRSLNQSEYLTLATVAQTGTPEFFASSSNALIEDLCGKGLVYIVHRSFGSADTLRVEEFIWKIISTDAKMLEADTSEHILQGVLKKEYNMTSRI